MKNIALTICYEGTDYFGWQATSTGPSIEQTLQRVLEKILSHPVKLQAASRTDRGVHAYGQVVNFFSPKYPRIESLNALLPPSIRVLAIEEKPSHFHPTIDATGKEYLYHIDTTAIQLPFRRHIAWHLPSPWDMDLAQQAAALLIGEHDFSAFCNQLEGRVYEHKRRNLWWIEYKPTTHGLTCYLAGNHFLYKMARNLVGTLAYVAKGKLTLSQLERLLNCKDRKQAGVCAPAHGLSLNRVFYNLPKPYSSIA